MRIMLQTWIIALELTVNGNIDVKPHYTGPLTQGVSIGEDGTPNTKNQTNIDKINSDSLVVASSVVHRGDKCRVKVQSLSPDFG